MSYGSGYVTKANLPHEWNPFREYGKWILIDGDGNNVHTHGFETREEAEAAIEIAIEAYDRTKAWVKAEIEEL